MIKRLKKFLMPIKKPFRMKFFNVSPLVRITLGLIMLTLSLILIGDMLGLIPNANQNQLDYRKSISESLAIQLSVTVERQNQKELEWLLGTIVKRNKSIRSLGLKKYHQTLLAQTSQHQESWQLKEDEHSNLNQLNVPLYAHQQRWGTLQVNFEPEKTSLKELLTQPSLISMLLFILVFGLLLYWLFLKRVLSELDPSSVVPDRVRSAFDILTEGLIMLDTSERIILVNTSFEKISGIKSKELIGKNISSLNWELQEDKMGLMQQKFPWSLLFENKQTPPSSSIKFKTAYQELHTFELNIAPIKAPDQSFKGAIVTIDDVTELEKKNSELARILSKLETSQTEIERQNLELIELATKDPLTHLLNRRSLFQSMDNIFLEAQNDGGIVSCLMLDIDHFKSVNDTLGHAAGDIVIKAFADIISETIREVDVVGRYGGEEFVVALPGLDELEAAKIADDIRLRIMKRSFQEISPDLQVTSSFGVASTINDLWIPTKVVDLADQALYVAKTSGRNRVVCYSQIEQDHTADVEIVKQELPEQKEEQNIVEEATPSSLLQEELSCGTAHSLIVDRLAQAIKLADRNKSNVIILTIYIDTLQVINNTFGYHVASKLRQTALQRLKEIFRDTDFILPEHNISLSSAQDGNFIAILNNIEQTALSTWILKRMLKALSQAINIDGHEIVMTANVGGSVYPTDTLDQETLLTYSKIALQQSMNEGRGNFSFYNTKINQISKEQLYIESQLHLALERDELYIEYQPIINMKTGETQKLEALLRWKHPELGQVSPENFILIAEQSGLINRLGTWLIEHASKQLKIWHESGYEALQMSINLSTVQFNQEHLAEDIIQIVQQVGISPESIVFELTETSFIKNLEELIHIVNSLRKEGFSIAIDDFGTGYSALSYLRKLPISFLKIDKSMIDNFPDDINDVSIVSGLIGLAHNLDIGVIVEGVEHEKQLNALYDLSCDEVQGYLISRPLNPKEMYNFLESKHKRVQLTKMAKNSSPLEMKGPSLSELINPHQ